jgi:hypothetical protein
MRELLLEGTSDFLWQKAAKRFISDVQREDVLLILAIRRRREAGYSV